LNRRGGKWFTNANHKHIRVKIAEGAHSVYDSNQNLKRLLLTLLLNAHLDAVERIEPGREIVKNGSI